MSISERGIISTADRQRGLIRYGLPAIQVSPPQGKLLALLADERVNVVEVEHQREAVGVPVGHTGVELTLLTRDPEHCEQLIAQLGEWGYPAERLD